MFCGPETVDVEGSTKHTAFPRSQSISILLYTECQKRRKVPQNQSNMCKKDYLLPDMAT